MILQHFIYIGTKISHFFSGPWAISTGSAVKVSGQALKLFEAMLDILPWYLNQPDQHESTLLMRSREKYKDRSPNNKTGYFCQTMAGFFRPKKPHCEYGKTETCPKRKDKRRKKDYCKHSTLFALKLALRSQGLRSKYYPKWGNNKNFWAFLIGHSLSTSAVPAFRWVKLQRFP